MTTRLLILVCLLVAIDCGRSTSVSAKQVAAPLYTLVGSRTTIEGSFHLCGKLGAYVLSGTNQIYLRPFATTATRYSRFDGSRVAISGVLLYAPSVGMPDPATLRSGHPYPQPAPAHFYMDLARSQTSLVSR